MSYKKIASPIITETKDGALVMYPVSYKYNGGIIIDGKWYRGFKVGKPKVPKGYKLVSIACGLQLNCQPPQATSRLIKI